MLSFRQRELSKHSKISSSASVYLSNTIFSLDVLSCLYIPKWFTKFPFVWRLLLWQLTVYSSCQQNCKCVNKHFETATFPFHCLSQRYIYQNIMHKTVIYLNLNPVFFPANIRFDAIDTASSLKLDEGKEGCVRLSALFPLWNYLQPL